MNVQIDRETLIEAHEAAFELADKLAERFRTWRMKNQWHPPEDHPCECKYQSRMRVLPTDAIFPSIDSLDADLIGQFTSWKCQVVHSNGKPCDQLGALSNFIQWPFGLATFREVFERLRLPTVHADAIPCHFESAAAEKFIGSGLTAEVKLGCPVFIRPVDDLQPRKLTMWSNAQVRITSDFVDSAARNQISCLVDPFAPRAERPRNYPTSLCEGTLFCLGFGCLGEHPSLLRVVNADPSGEVTIETHQGIEFYTPYSLKKLS